MNVENTRASMSRALDIEVFKAYFFKAFLFSSVDLSTWFLARLRSYSLIRACDEWFPTTISTSNKRSRRYCSGRAHGGEEG